MKKEGKYYGPGEGPPLDDLFEIGVYSLYHGVGVTESGKKVCWSIKGRDGYFETARMAVEAALASARTQLSLYQFERIGGMTRFVAQIDQTVVENLIKYFDYKIY